MSIIQCYNPADAEALEVIRRDQIEYLKSNSSEIEPLVNRIDSDIALLYCLHSKDPKKAHRLISQMIDMEVLSEAELKAREIYYDE